MRKNEKILRAYIREAIDLGNIQFSPYRTDGADTSEPNTPEEEAIYGALVRRIVHNEPIDPAEVAILSDLVKSKRYGEEGSGFFAGPRNPNSTLFRGHAYPLEWGDQHGIGRLAVSFPTHGTNWSGVNVKRRLDLRTGDPNVTFNPPYIFGNNPGEGNRGWTVDIDVAAKFSLSYAKKLSASTGGKVLAVVLCTVPADSPPGSFLDFRRGVYNTEDTAPFLAEREVLNLAPVACRSAYAAYFTYKPQKR